MLAKYKKILIPGELYVTNKVINYVKRPPKNHVWNYFTDKPLLYIYTEDSAYIQGITLSYFYFGVHKIYIITSLKESKKEFIRKIS